LTTDTTSGPTFGNVVQVTYTVQDNLGNAPVPVPQQIPAEDQAPIASLELDVVGYSNGCNTTFSSGSGIITYKASPAFTAQSDIQDCAVHFYTVETANSSYGLLPSGSSTEFQQKFQIWTQLPTGCATSIGAGDGTSPWITGCTQLPSGDYNVYYWDSLSTDVDKWQQTTTGSGVEIAAMAIAGGGGTVENWPLLVDAKGSIYYGEPQGDDVESSNGTDVAWTQIPGCGRAISGSGALTLTPYVMGPYVIGCDAVSAGYTPYDEPGGINTPWQALTGEGGVPGIAVGGVRISVSNDDSELWMVNSSNQLFSYVNGSWDLEAPGLAVDVSAGSGTSTVANRPPWAVGLKNDLYQWNGSGWDAMIGAPPAKRVSIGSNGTVWIIDPDGNIWFSK
jgi:hypothetical protein